MQLVSRPTHILKLARPPFKPISRYGVRRIPGALARRIADFAAALQARYDGKSRDFRSQGLVYRQASLGLCVNRIYRQIRLLLSPRLQLSFQTAPRQGLRLSANRTLQGFLFPFAAARLSLPSFPSPALKPAAISIWRRAAAPFPEAALHLLEIQRVVQETSRLSSQVSTQMVQRLAARLERVETVRSSTPTATRDGNSVPSLRTRFAQPLPMALPVPQVTLNRTQAIRLEEIQPSDPKSQHGIRKQISAAPLQEFSSYPPTDMNRLADQVVQVINDRVTARQERFGRI